MKTVGDQIFETRTMMFLLFRDCLSGLYGDCASSSRIKQAPGSRVVRPYRFHRVVSDIIIIRALERRFQREAVHGDQAREAREAEVERYVDDSMGNDVSRASRRPIGTDASRRQDS